MIRHIVLVRFRSDVSPADIAGHFAELGALQPLVPGFLAFGAGANISPEPLNQGFTHAFTADFADAAARDAYLVLPDHKAAGARLVEAVEGGQGGLAVIDFELP